MFSLTLIDRNTRPEVVAHFSNRNSEDFKQRLETAIKEHYADDDILEVKIISDMDIGITEEIIVHIIIDEIVKPYEVYLQPTFDY